MNSQLNRCRLNRHLATALLLSTLLLGIVPGLVLSAHAESPSLSSNRIIIHRTAEQNAALQTTTIQITATGFSPASITADGPIEITWQNKTSETHMLKSGLPPTGANLFLPLISSPGSGLNTSSNRMTQRVQTFPQVRAASEEFTVTLKPGESYTHSFATPGTYPFYLSTAPKFAGQLIIEGTVLQSSSPANAEAGVAVTRESILTFSGPLDPQSVTADAFSAHFGARALPFRLHHSDDGRTVTLFYTEPLPGNARIRITADGDKLRDTKGQPVDADGDRATGGTAIIDFDTLSLTVIPGTSVCGRVFASVLVAGETDMDLNEPLTGVTITVDGRASELRTTTDGSGNFCLDPAPSGRFFVHIDGRTATSPAANGAYYPFVGKAWMSVAGKQSNIGNIYLPLVPAGTLQPVSQTADTTIGFAPSVVAEHPEFADVSITVPAGSLFADDGTPGGKVGIAPVPPDRLPGQLPPGLNFPLVITVQTDGATNFDTPAPICFPNLPDPDTGQTLPANGKSALWSFNHDTGRFDIAGPMTVSTDGTLVCTDPGVGVPAPGWHGTRPGVRITRGPIITHPRPTPPEEEVCEDQPSEGTCHQKEGYQPSVNGCGPQWLIDITPSFANFDDPMSGPFFDLPGAPSCSFQKACNTHDEGYGTCNSSKSAIDSNFLADMNATCDSCYGSLNPLRQSCYGFAKNFYNAVSTLGDFPYNEAQDQSCECDECEELARSAGNFGPFKPFELNESGTATTGNTSTENANSENANLEDDAPIELETGVHYYAVANLETGIVQRGTAGSNGIAFEQALFLAPNTDYRIMLLQADTLREGQIRVTTPASGATFELPDILLVDSLGWDIDEDGLGATGEFIMGTDPLHGDSDGDGIGDGAEVSQGTNPLDDVLVATGIISGIDTPGSAQDLCVQNQVVVVADGNAGVAVFNVFQGMNPTAIAAVDTPGSAQAVACAGNRAAVADGAEGLAIVDLSDPPAAKIVHQISFNGTSVQAVTTANGMAYVGLRDGNVVQINIATGAEINRRLLPDVVEDVAISGDYLYALTSSNLYAIHLADFSLIDSIRATSRAGLLLGRKRLFVDANTAYMTHRDGYDTANVSPFGLLTPGTNGTSNQSGWRQIVSTGSGIALATVGVTNAGGDGTDNVSLYDTSDPSQTDRFLAEFETPGVAHSLALYQGLAYVADGEAGLQIINYLAQDRSGITPTVTLRTNFAPGLAQSNAFMRLTADAKDNVQVRNVEFYINDALVGRDGNAPFEYRFTTPPSQEPTMTVRAKATDTGGNIGWSELQTLTLTADATVPRVYSVVPAVDTTVGISTTTIAATFSEALDPASLAGSFQLFRAGTDGTLGTDDDVAVSGGVVGYDDATHTAMLNFTNILSNDKYRALLTTGIADKAGNKFPAVFGWNFEIKVVASTAPKQLLASDGVQGDGFGVAVGLDGDTVVVGANNDVVNGNSSRGSAYVYKRNDANWVEVKKLAGSDSAQFDQFGSAVAISGDTILVSAPRKSVDGTPQRGVVYLFARDAGGADAWGQVARFAEDVGSFGLYGSALAIDGNRFVVGAEGANTVFIYQRSAAGATDWQLLKSIRSSRSTGNDNFGTAMALEDDRLLVGASLDDLVEGDFDNKGAAYIFERNEGGADNWGEVARLTEGAIRRSGRFGRAVALRGDLIAIGASHSQRDPVELSSVGTLYIFQRDESAEMGWRAAATLDAAESVNAYRSLGRAVAINNQQVLGGAPGYIAADEIEQDAEQGAVYLFAANQDGAWSETGRWTLNPPLNGARLGNALSTDGASTVVGASGFDGNRGMVVVYFAE